MSTEQKHPLRVLTLDEEQELHRIVKATSERLDVVKRAAAVLGVQTGRSCTEGARDGGEKSGESISHLIERFNQRGLAALRIAPGRGRKPTDTAEQRARLVAAIQREPDREQDQTATWSLMLLRRALRTTDLPQISTETIRETLHEAGDTFGKTRTWCPTGMAVRTRKAGVVTGQDPAGPEKKRASSRPDVQAEAAGRARWTEDEAGPYQAIPHAGENGHPVNDPQRHPHDYQRGGTATMLTLLHPATGVVRAIGVRSAPNAILHPWLKEQFVQELAEIECRTPAATLPEEAERPPAARWETWLGHPPPRPLPPLRMIVIWDTLAGHRTTTFVEWLLDHGVMPLSTPLSGSWLTMAESVQRILVRRALSGHHPQTPEQIMEWLEQTVRGWNADPTPCVWNGKRRRRRERARLRRLGGSGAAVACGKPIAR